MTEMLNTPWREDDWQARDLRLRNRLDVATDYLLSKQNDPKAIEALAAVLFVQSCLKLDREADALARAEDRDCMPCHGTGRHQGAFGGPGWPLCGFCGGSGKESRR